jgi:NADH:ubiquinone oxidoreductase subunit 6 (subunit J)
MTRGAAYKVIAICLLALLFALAVTEPAWPEEEVTEDQIPTNEDVGESLFGTDEGEGYGLAFFLIGLLLLVAMLGGVFLAKEEESE